MSPKFKTLKKHLKFNIAIYDTAASESKKIHPSCQDLLENSSVVEYRGSQIYSLPTHIAVESISLMFCNDYNFVPISGRLFIIG